MGLYLLASIIPMVLSLANNPLIAINMSPEDFAITGYVTSFNTLLSPIIVFYLMHYYVKSYFKIDTEERLKLKATLFKALIYFSGALSLLCLGGVVGYNELFNKSSELPTSPYLILSVLTLPLAGIYTLILTDYRISRQSRKFFNLSIIRSVVSVALVTLLVVIFKWGALGKLLAPFIGTSLFFGWACWHNRALFKIPFDWQRFRAMLRFCFPLTIAASLSFFSSGYEIVLLERLGDYTQMGYYVVGAQIAGYLTIIATSINATFQPDIYESMAKGEYRRVAKFAAMMVGIIVMVVTLFVVFAPILIKILTAGRYMESISFARILSLSVVASIIYYISSEITMALGKSNIVLTNRIISSILMVLLYGALINRYDFLGAAWGVVASFLILSIVNLLLVSISKKLKLWH